MHDRSDAYNTGRHFGKCLYQPLSFMCSKKARPIYMCNAEKKFSAQLADLIEKWDRLNGGLRFMDPDGWLCGGKIREGDGSIINCTGTKGAHARKLPRKVTLFTLNHGLLSIVVRDWVCASCEFENRYTGETHGIYPGAKHRVFTVELLYFWMNEGIGGGMSFRAIFELTNNLHLSSTYRRRIETGRLDLLAP